MDKEETEMMYGVIGGLVFCKRHPKKRTIKQHIPDDLSGIYFHFLNDDGDDDFEFVSYADIIEMDSTLEKG